MLSRSGTDVLEDLVGPFNTLIYLGMGIDVGTV